MEQPTMKLLITLSIICAAVSCSPVAYPVGTPNPLDEPGATEPTAAELHLGNLQAITSNPAYK